MIGDVAPLHLAVKQENPEVIKALLEHDKTDPNQSVNEGRRYTSLQKMDTLKL